MRRISQPPIGLVRAVAALAGSRHLPYASVGGAQYTSLRLAERLGNPEAFQSLRCSVGREALSLCLMSGNGLLLSHDQGISCESIWRSGYFAEGALRV